VHTLFLSRRPFVLSLYADEGAAIPLGWCVAVVGLEQFSRRLSGSGGIRVPWGQPGQRDTNRKCGAQRS